MKYQVLFSKKEKKILLICCLLNLPAKIQSVLGILPYMNFYLINLLYRVYLCVILIQV